jgi:putative aminopeptidase FrvX
VTKGNAVGEEDHELDRHLLQELLSAYGPCGQEDAVRDLCRQVVEPLVDATWVDPAGNLVALVRGGDAPAVRAMAHMDELSMLVKRVERDGSLHVTQLGTMYPGNFGLGPVAILGDVETLCGVLTLGSEHTTNESHRIWETKPDQGDKAMDWTHVSIFTGRTPEQLSHSGIRPGSRVCVHRSKRTLVEFGDYLGCYFMDDRAAITALLQAARRLSQPAERPAGDVYFVFTTNEEIGGVGGSYASRTLPGELTLAVEVGPTEAEYATTCDGGPIIAYSDAQCVYDKDVADALIAITQQGLSPQAAVLGAFESDASQSKASGLSRGQGFCAFRR